MLHALLTRRQLLRSSSIALPAAFFAPQLLAQPAPPPLRFLVVGDWGRGGRLRQREVAGQMANAPAAAGARFIVSTGDNFYNFGVSSANDRQWHSSFEGIYTEAAHQAPWFPVLGNHDYGGSISAQVARSRVSDRWRMLDRWYDVDGAEFGRPDLHLFFIDTVAWIGREGLPFLLLGSPIGREDQRIQEAWLEQKLERSCAPIKLVFGHHPIYSVGPHGGRMRLRRLDDLLRRTGVTAYVNGHDHCLYHISQDGMHYVCSGGGSQELDRFTGDPSVEHCVLPGHCTPADPTWHYYRGRAGFAAFNIGEDRLAVDFIEWDGTAQRSIPIPVRAPTPCRAGPQAA